LSFLISVIFAAAAGLASVKAQEQDTQTPHGSLPAASPHNSVQFQVGQRNVKSLFAEQGAVWVGTSGGLIHYDPKRDRYQRHDNTTGLLSNGIFYVGKVRDEIWAGTYGGGLSVFNPDSQTWRNYNIPHGLGDAFIYDVLEASNGDIWIATWSGVNRVIGGAMDDIKAWSLHTVDSTGGGLPNDWVYGLAEGKNGEIWLATEGGLARYEAGQWENWNHAKGLGAPYDLVKDAMPFRNDPGEVSSHHARQKAEQNRAWATSKLPITRITSSRSKSTMPVMSGPAPGVAGFPASTASAG
jgi:ligand-binding sensor domain-containing protein